jgi:hypothetical protein
MVPPFVLENEAYLADKVIGMVPLSRDAVRCKLPNDKIRKMVRLAAVAGLGV